MSNLSDFTGAPEGILSKYEEFTVSGTWTKDPGATWVAFHVVAAGANGSSYGGCGGQGFFYIQRAADLPSSASVTVGASGISGGNSVFSSYTAKGGFGPLSSSVNRTFYFGEANQNDLFVDFLNKSRGFFESYGSTGVNPAGISVYGGGGGTSSSTSGNNGSSVFAGDGGLQNQNGQFPGGGGGSNGTGADGVVRIWQW